MDESIYLRISPALRRSAYYVLAASVPLAAVCSWVSRFARSDTLASAISFGAVVFLLCMTTLVPLHWVLRIDHEGIARRLFFGWGDVWTWGDLASGRIEKRHSYELVDPARPWWRRRLCLDYLAPTDISRALQLINAHYRLPRPPQVPDELDIKYGNFFRRRLRLDAQGICFQGPKEARAYTWGEVQRVHITRMDRLRRDFSSLEIVLPDREIELWLHGTSPNWRGATAEVVNVYLACHLPAERIEADVFGERPARRADLEKQLAKAKDRCRDSRRSVLILLLLLAAALIGMAVTQSVLKAAVMAAFCVLSLGPLCWFASRELRSRCLALERQLASFDEVDSHLSQIRD